MRKWWEKVVLAVGTILLAAGIIHAYQPASMQDWNIGESALQFRTFVNNALAGLQSSFSGTSFPSNPVAGQLFYNSSTRTLYQYSGSTWTSFGANVPTYHFADLGTNVPLSFAGIGICADCAVAFPCTGSGGGALFRSTGSQFNCSNPGALDISKLFQPALGDYDMGPHVLSGNVENVLDATKYIGSDLGDQVTAAAAALPTVTIDGNSYHIGTVYIPQAASVYSYADTMQTDPTVLIRCEHGAVLKYNGTGDAVNQQSPHPLNNVSYGMGGVEGCQWTAPTIPASNTNIIHTGDALGLRYTNLHIDGYTAAGDNAILVENHNYFTEHEILTGLMLTNNTHGIAFLDSCAGGGPDCQNSFDNETVDFYCATTTVRVGDCMAVNGGGNVLHSHVRIRANVTFAGSAVLAVDASSHYNSNADIWDVEGNVGGAYMVNYTGSSNGVIINDGAIHGLNLSNVSGNGTVPLYAPIVTLDFTIPGTYSLALPFAAFTAMIYGGGGGGSGGGVSAGKGGGQGGFINCVFNSSAFVPYTVIVGAGGAAGTAGNDGGNGGDSVVGASGGCTAHGGAKGTTSAAGAGGATVANSGPALNSSTGTSGSGQSGGTGGVPGFCPCGGSGGNAGLAGNAGSSGEVFIQQR